MHLIGCVSVIPCLVIVSEGLLQCLILILHNDGRCINRMVLAGGLCLDVDIRGLTCCVQL